MTQDNPCSPTHDSFRVSVECDYCDWGYEGWDIHLADQVMREHQTQSAAVIHCPSCRHASLDEQHCSRCGEPIPPKDGS